VEASEDLSGNWATDGYSGKAADLLPGCFAVIASRDPSDETDLNLRAVRRARLAFFYRSAKCGAVRHGIPQKEAVIPHGG